MNFRERVEARAATLSATYQAAEEARCAERARRIAFFKPIMDAWLEVADLPVNYGRPLWIALNMTAENDGTALHAHRRDATTRWKLSVDEGEDGDLCISVEQPGMLAPIREQWTVADALRFLEQRCAEALASREGAE